VHDAFPEATAIVKIERMLALASLVGISLDDLDAARRRLAAHEHENDQSWGLDRRTELARAMKAEIEILAAAYRVLAAAVARAPTA
jgi:hypothetical protein